MTTLGCHHEGRAFGVPLCLHIRARAGGMLECVRRYSGVGVENEILCVPCADERDKGELIATELLCETCYASATENVYFRVRGSPEVRVRDEPINTVLVQSRLPVVSGAVLDVAPIEGAGGSEWLALASDGELFRFDADSSRASRVAAVDLVPELNHEPWMGRALKHRLHVSRGGRFAAVVNDFGRHGCVIDLVSGKVTATLDGGDYCPETVPFSLAFVEIDGMTLAVHRSAWNRLDLSDPATGKLLTARMPTSYGQGEKRPEHYLDYFHGALYVSPGSRLIFDDGWVWHPLGCPVVWSLERWASGNVWESEDGPSKRDVCAPRSDWGQGACWVDDQRLVLSGIGDDEEGMIEGARVFDITGSEKPSSSWRSDLRWTSEIMTIPGPVGMFFTDGASLFSSSDLGLSRWSLSDGARTGVIPGFCPTYHHRTSGELVQLVGSELIRWRVDSL
jgi:hypothetical protein